MSMHSPKGMVVEQITIASVLRKKDTYSIGQWLCLSWQSSCFLYQRSTLQMQFTVKCWKGQTSKTVVNFSVNKVAESTHLKQEVSWTVKLSSYKVSIVWTKLYQIDGTFKKGKQWFGKPIPKIMKNTNAQNNLAYPMIPCLVLNR